MEQVLQQWRLDYEINDCAFESLIAILSAYGFSLESFSSSSVAFNMLSPSFLSNINDGVLGQNGATSIAPLTSQLVPFPASVDNEFASYVSSVHNAGAGSSSNAIVSELVEDPVWNPKVAQKNSHPIACVRCWAQKKKDSWRMAKKDTIDTQKTMRTV